MPLIILALMDSRLRGNDKFNTDYGIFQRTRLYLADLQQRDGSLPPVETRDVPLLLDYHYTATG